jgi:SAM-dependent methyltransferase
MDAGLGAAVVAAVEGPAGGGRHGEQRMSVLERCRSCGATDLMPVVSLGQTPLANRLLTAAQLSEPEPTYPLDVVFCPRCTLVQLVETVPPEQLFREYFYFSSFSDTMLQSAAALAERLTAERRLGPQSLVVEVASNDGYLLQYYRQRGVPVLGIEPAMNIAAVARERGIPTLNEFFGRELGERLRDEGQRADVLHANNVLAHIPDLNGMVAGIAAVLKEKGLVVIEVGYLRDLIDKVLFDTIYHEHLCYHSLTSLTNLFRRHGMIVFDVEYMKIHGGSLRVFASRVEATPAVSRKVLALLEEEQVWGVGRAETYRAFGRKIQEQKATLLELLHGLKKQGKRIAAYGASAKGSTLLNCYGIGKETLDYVVDRSTVKQGHYAPGTHLPIHAPERLLEDQPDYVVLLTWNFAEEILAQQAEYRRRGGKFIMPVGGILVV